MKTDMPKDKLCEKLEKKLNNKLEKMGASFTVKARTQYKNNETVIGLAMNDGGGNAVPSVNLTDAELIKMQAGDLKIKDIAKHLMKTFARTGTMNLNIEDLTTKENILESVIPQVFDSSNKEHFDQEGIVNTEYLNLVVTYAVPVQGMPGGGAGSFKIQENLLRSAGIDKEELHKAALKNMEEKITTMKLSDMTRHLMPMMEAPNEDVPLYVTTSSDNMYGAAAILTDKFQQKLQQMQDVTQKPIVVLPSSIHEVITTPLEPGLSNEMLQMVIDINTTEVQPQERLSDCIYIFDNGKMKVMDDVECLQEQDEDMEME